MKYEDRKLTASIPRVVLHPTVRLGTVCDSKAWGVCILAAKTKRLHSFVAMKRDCCILKRQALVPDHSANLRVGSKLHTGVSLLLILLTCLSHTPALSGGELGTLREEVRDDSPSTSDRADGIDSDDDRFHMDSDSSWGELLFWMLASPFWGPPVMVGDNYSESGYFPHYPYENGTPGFMVGEFDAPTEGYSAHLRTRFEYADNFDDLSRIGGRVLFEHTSRFGIDSSFDLHREQLSPTSQDDLSLGDANLVFRFAQSDLLIMRTGLGVNWLNDDAGTELGFNFTYGGDLFPIKPWVISSELDWGTLGDATLFHFRGTVGVQLNRVTVYTGYDFLDIGRAQTKGLVAGVELWF